MRPEGGRSKGRPIAFFEEGNRGVCLADLVQAVALFRGFAPAIATELYRAVSEG